MSDSGTAGAASAAPARTEATVLTTERAEAPGMPVGLKRSNPGDSEIAAREAPAGGTSTAGGSTATAKRVRRTCPYLGTINKHMLDFDFEKVCSICLSNQHVYACLVCGRYFQGRGKSTFAFMHALEQRHFVYVNLTTYKVYCLPDNYEVQDYSLQDIIYNLNPTYTPEDVARLSTEVFYGKSLDGADYLPGCVGLNNLSKTDFFAVVIQSLCTVIPLRNFLLLLDLSHKQKFNAVVKTLSELMRKIFNRRNFKGIVSPHEFLQAVGVESQKKFRIGEQADPLALFTWLLNVLHRDQRDRKTGGSVIHDCFQGQVLVTNAQSGEAKQTPFLYLTLDLPSAPIFKDSLERNMIPTVPIFDLLQKFDGETDSGPSPVQRVKCTLWKLPRYLVLAVKRFSKNNFFIEKNPTIVTFPVKNLDLREYVHPDALEDNSVTRYNLVANICHHGKPHDGFYKAQVLHAPTNEWHEMEDLRVTPVLPQFVALSESYIQFYQRQDVLPDGTLDEALRQKCLQDLTKVKIQPEAADDIDDIFAA
ncbi:ubiquitin carboxyl-terminal [Cyclospora cayetanensis]|uniref:Ubiquitin carboxyl-terminal n=1 Tax=Cyclospora cayetanensis TaxID=88456 RepID=A0A1D3D6F5_9EIME|nr:ubiquitin carboxyl-terminal [Cyclospora cayetanensis]